MRIIRAEKAGFCFGVKRAIEMAEQAINNGSTASLGPLIHNQQVVDYLTDKGIAVINSIGDVQEGQQLVIRSHGVPPEIYSEAERKSIKIIDATCPYVQKAQKLAAKSSKDSFVVVVGDRRHPEVTGILGWAGKEAQALETIEEAKLLPCYSSIAVLAQTTQSKANFSAITEELKAHTANLVIHDTICGATEERQASACDLAMGVDLMIVVGGESSSNTRKLGEISRQKTRTWTIETAEELQQIWFEGAKSVGLTAGASTPDWIIEEVYRTMSEMMEKTSVALEEEVTADPRGEKAEEPGDWEIDEDNMTMENFGDDLPKIYCGAIVKGTVVKVTHDEVYVDISWKSEGVIPLEELAAAKVLDIKDMVKVGDALTTMVIRMENQEGYPVLSRKKVSEFEARERLAELAETKEEVKAKVIEAVKGGLLVDLGMRGFVPASQIDLGFVDDLGKYVGKTLRLRVIEYDQAKKKVVLSQKAILAEEQGEKREKLLQNLQVGDTVKGTVRRLSSFGAFVDLGGVDALLHVSDMAFSRVNHPSEIVNVDDELEAQVLAIDGEKGRISLGLKQLKTNPWAVIPEKYPVGTIVQGKVVRIAAFGAFVQIDDGIDALVHISQLADQRVNKVEDVVRVNQIITAKVIELKPEEKRISLSIKEALADSRNNLTAGDAVGEIQESIEDKN